MLLFSGACLVARARVSKWSAMAFRIALFTLVVVGVVNFAVFVVAWSQLGDAFAGYAEAGRYYLSEHGRLTEVSGTVFALNAAHTSSLLVTHPLALASAFVLRWMDWRHDEAQERAVDAM